LDTVLVLIFGFLSLHVLLGQNHNQIGHPLGLLLADIVRFAHRTFGLNPHLPSKPTVGGCGAGLRQA
jgi:hypothetical protein